MNKTLLSLIFLAATSISAHAAKVTPANHDILKAWQDKNARKPGDFFCYMVSEGQDGSRKGHTTACGWALSIDTKGVGIYNRTTLAPGLIAMFSYETRVVNGKTVASGDWTNETVEQLKKFADPSSADGKKLRLGALSKFNEVRLNCNSQLYKNKSYTRHGGDKPFHYAFPASYASDPTQYIKRYLSASNKDYFEKWFEINHRDELLQGPVQSQVKALVDKGEARLAWQTRLNCN